MTDAQVLEAQCVENLQREDVHPLEEANAFSAMLREHYDVATIAAKIGKPAAFVVSRMPETSGLARCRGRGSHLHQASARKHRQPACGAALWGGWHIHRTRVGWMAHSSKERPARPQDKSPGDM